MVLRLDPVTELPHIPSHSAQISLPVITSVFKPGFKRIRCHLSASLAEAAERARQRRKGRAVLGPHRLGDEVELAADREHHTGRVSPSRCTPLIGILSQNYRRPPQYLTNFTPKFTTITILLGRLAQLGPALWQSGAHLPAVGLRAIACAALSSAACVRHRTSPSACCQWLP